MMAKNEKNNDDGYHDIKFRIISEKVMRDLVEFLDEIQFEAAKGKGPEDIHIINLCNHLITQLINSQEGYNYHKLNKKKKEEEDIIFEFPPTMSDDEIDKILSEFDRFLHGWDKAYNKDKKKKSKDKKKKTDTFHRPHLDDVAQYMSLEEIKEYLIDDPELSDYERFELYYDEHCRVEREKQRRKEEKNSTSYDKMLKDLGIEGYNNERKNKK